METAIISLNSSCLKAAQGKGSDLFLTFNDGSEYVYPGQADQLEALVNAPSAGRYFNENLYHLGETAESYTG